MQERAYNVRCSFLNGPEVPSYHTKPHYAHCLAHGISCLFILGTSRKAH